MGLGSSDFPIDRVDRKDEGRLPELIALAERDCEPGDDKTRAQAVALLSVLPARAASETDAKLLLMAFDIGLKDVPADLVVKGTEEAIRRCKFRPSPAEVRSFVEDELSARRRRLRRLEANLRAVEDERSRPRVDPCPPDEARRIIEETMGAMTL